MRYLQTHEDMFNENGDLKVRLPYTEEYELKDVYRKIYSYIFDRAAKSNLEIKDRIISCYNIYNITIYNNNTDEYYVFVKWLKNNHSDYKQFSNAIYVDFEITEDEYLSIKNMLYYFLKMMEILKLMMMLKKNIVIYLIVMN